MDSTTALLKDAADELKQIAGLWTHLRARLEPTSNASEIHTAPTSKPPINLHVSDLLFEIRLEAEALAHVLMDETDWQPTTSAMPGLLDQIAARYGHWLTKDTHEILAYTDWAHHTLTRVTAALETPPNPRFLGTCPVEECGGDLYVQPDKHHGGWHTYATCRSCGSTVAVAEQIAYIKRLSRDWLLSRRDLVDALQIWGISIKADTINKWVTRGKLVSRGGLYKVSDAIQIALPPRKTTPTLDKKTPTPKKTRVG